MRPPFLLSGSVAAVLIAIAGACEARRVQVSRTELTRLQRTVAALRLDVTDARRANAAERHTATAADAAAANAASPYVSTGDAEFDASGGELLRRVYALRRRIDRNPSEWIPEIRHARDSDWFEAVASTSPWGDSKLPYVAAYLRREAQSDFAESMYYALNRYLGEHDGVLPKDVRELIPYFGGSCDEASLARYRMIASGPRSDVKGEAAVISEIMSPAEQENAETTGFEDLRVKVRGITMPGESRAEFANTRTILGAMEQYRRDHGGESPTEVQQLRPYVSDVSILEGVTLDDEGFSTATELVVTTDGSDDVSKVIDKAVEQYRRDHYGEMPTDAQQLRPYISDPSILKSVKLETKR